jgi:hypothetical protein
MLMYLERSNLLAIHQNTMITYFSPNCKSPILLGRFMLWRAQSTVPTPDTASPRMSLESALFTALWETHVLRCPCYRLQWINGE